MGGGIGTASQPSLSWSFCGYEGATFARERAGDGEKVGGRETLGSARELAAEGVSIYARLRCGAGPRRCETD
jgi:hypothetical protein